MGSRETVVHLTEETHRYLKECCRLRAIMDRRLVGMQDTTDLAIRYLYRIIVRTMQREGHAHLLDAKLVKAAGLKLETPPRAQAQAENEEKTR